MIRNPSPPPAGSEAASQIEADLIEQCIASVREALWGLRYGTVALTIHEGRVVQIDVTEKKRLKPHAP